MLGISNYQTSTRSRVEQNTGLSKAEIDGLRGLVGENLPHDHYYGWNANINGTIIQLVTNNFHLMDFWMESWYPAPATGISPHGTIYAITDVPNHKPFCYYSSEAKTAVLVNTDYYGQCKSWALGIVADVMEMGHNVHSIHAAVVDIGGCGVAIIGPTGAGKSTLSYGLALTVPYARIHSDDWAYLEYVGEEGQGRTIAHTSERKSYLRTDIATSFPHLAELFNRCKLENVGQSYTDIPNSRAILDPLWVGGTASCVAITRIQVVLLLRRDAHSLPIEKLDTEQAIDILRKGEYMDDGKLRSVPFYNPYLLVKDEVRTRLQVDFFRHLLLVADCYVLNTGVQSIEETRSRALEVAATSCALAPQRQW